MVSSLSRSISRIAGPVHYSPPGCPCHAARNHRHSRGPNRRKPPKNGACGLALDAARDSIPAHRRRLLACRASVGARVKLVVGIVRPERLEAVKEELAEARVFRLTVSDAQGVATGSPQATSAAQAYAGAQSAPQAEPRVRLEIAVNEEFVEATVRAIARGAQLHGGSPGDGKVLVLPLEEAIRIRTGERGPDAI